MDFQHQYDKSVGGSDLRLSHTVERRQRHYLPLRIEVNGPSADRQRCETSSRLAYCWTVIQLFDVFQAGTVRQPETVQFWECLQLRKTVHRALTLGTDGNHVRPR